MTKLAKDQKMNLKMFKINNPDVKLFSFPDYNVTVAIERTSETLVRVAWSLCSESEEKFRRKVGEYMALNRLDFGFPVTCYYDRDFLQLAEQIAVMVG